MTGKEKCLLHNFCVQYDPCQPYSPVWQEAFWTLRLTATVFCVLSRNPEPLAVGYNQGLREFYRFYNSAPEDSGSSCLSLALFLFSSRLGSLCDHVPGMVWFCFSSLFMMEADCLSHSAMRFILLTNYQRENS